MEIAALIIEAIREDLGSGDVTTLATIPEGLHANAHVEVQADGVICGLEIARQVFATVDPTLVWSARHADGDVVDRAAVVATVRGAARGILQAERVALNFLQRLSGIATLTRRFVDRVRGTRTRILDTRKTLPGWRALERYAVTKGGGGNHRAGLFDRYLIKSNHIDLCETIDEAIHRVLAHRQAGLLLEVEARDLEEVGEAADLGVDIILLDNFPVRDLKKAMEVVKGRAKIEASGGITLDNVRAYAEAGVDYISIGALTHSAPALTIHLPIMPVAGPHHQGPL